MEHSPPATGRYSAPVQSVTELTRSIRGLLETQYPFASVRGEISNLRAPFSGHSYFTLKDDQAQMRAVLFKQQQRYLQQPLRDGQQVVCAGRITVYEQRGEYQMLVDFVDFQGAGPLQYAFERLKTRLAEEGLFDAARKRVLPFLPERIGLITSPGGAAVHDFLRMAHDRFPGVPVEIMPVKVQGGEAAGEIVEAIRIMNERQSCQVLILCRGGGSLEDLWAFNEEKVARAIVASNIPVVSAIGHEVDFTIADFVADFRAPTPTAAAEAVLPDRRQLQSKVLQLTRQLANASRSTMDDLRRRVAFHRRLLSDPTALLQHHLLRLDYTQSAMLHALTNRTASLRTRLQQAVTRLAAQNPAQRLTHHQGLLRQLEGRLRHAMLNVVQQRRARLGRAASLLDAVSPLAVLGRGYAIARQQDGRLVRSVQQLALGEPLEVILTDGLAACRVTGLRPDKNQAN